MTSHDPLTPDDPLTMDDSAGGLLSHKPIFFSCHLNSEPPVRTGKAEDLTSKIVLVHPLIQGIEVSVNNIQLYKTFSITELAKFQFCFGYSYNELYEKLHTCHGIDLKMNLHGSFLTLSVEAAGFPGAFKSVKDIVTNSLVSWQKPVMNLDTESIEKLKQLAPQFHDVGVYQTTDLKTILLVADSEEKLKAFVRGLSDHGQEHNFSGIDLQITDTECFFYPS